MEPVAYETAAPEKRIEFKPANVQPILQTSTKKFTDAFNQCKMSGNRRWLALNSKNPGFIKVFQRITAKHIDLKDVIQGEVTDIHMMVDQDKFVVSSTEKEVVIVSMTENADQSLSYTDVKTTLSSVAQKVVTYAKSEQEKGIAALTADGKLYDISFTGGDAQLISAASNIKADQMFLGASIAAGAIAVPGADGSVQLLDTAAGFNSLLSKSWFPYGGEVVNDVLIMENSTSEELKVVTAASDCSELRFWTVTGQAATLNQTLTLNNAAPKKAEEGEEKKEGDETPEAEAQAANQRRLIVDPNSAYIGVLSSVDSNIVMLEVDQKSKFSIRRVTEWASSNPFVCGTLFIRKHTVGSTLAQDLALMGRTKDQMAYLVFDQRRLEGAPNLGETKKQESSKAKKGDDAVMKWFGSGEQNNNSASNQNNNVAVTSSKSGNRGNQQEQDAKTAAALQQEMAKVTESVRVLITEVKQSVEGLQPLASENLSMFKAPGFNDLADALGRAEALALNLPAGGGRAPVQNDKIRRLYQSITDNAYEQMNRTALIAFEKTLKKQAERVGPRLSSGAVTAKDIAVPKLGGTDSMMKFAQRMDRAHGVQNDQMRREVDKVRQQCDEMVASVKRRSTAAMSTTKHHMKNVSDELNDLRREVKALADAQPRAAGTVAAGGNNSKQQNVLEKCRALPLTGQWEQAFAQLLEAANIALLVQFLELDEVVANRATITGPGCLSFPVIFALCQQLTHNINSQAGTIPLRVGWLHDVLLGWDEEFQALKRGQSKDSDVFRRCSGDFGAMSEVVASINRGDVDAATRRQLNFVKRMLQQLS